MRLAKLVVGACAAVALVVSVPDAGAKGGKGGGRGGKSGGHHAHSHTAASGGSSHHRRHGLGFTSVFVGSSLVFWPRAYYWPDYYPGAVPAVEYWYYCQPYAAYYPYVQECPTEWQPVLPTAPSPES